MKASSFDIKFVKNWLAYEMLMHETTTPGPTPVSVLKFDEHPSLVIRGDCISRKLQPVNVKTGKLMLKPLDNTVKIIQQTFSSPCQN